MCVGLVKHAVCGMQDYGIECPSTKSVFSLKTGEIITWCDTTTRAMITSELALSAAQHLHQTFILYSVYSLLSDLCIDITCQKCAE